MRRLALRPLSAALDRVTPGLAPPSTLARVQAVWAEVAPRRLGVALAELSNGLAPATTIAGVQARWAEAVGPAIAAEAEPLSERDGIVTVSCRSAVWAQELELLSPDLVERLNGALGGPSLSRLRFVSGGRRRVR